MFEQARSCDGFWQPAERSGAYDQLPHRTVRRKFENWRMFEHYDVKSNGFITERDVTPQISNALLHF